MEALHSHPAHRVHADHSMVMFRNRFWLCLALYPSGVLLVKRGTAMALVTAPPRFPDRDPSPPFWAPLSLCMVEKLLSRAHGTSFLAINQA